MGIGAIIGGMPGSSGITNGAGSNVIPKSDGTNLVASSVTDDGTTFAINTDKFTVTESSGNTVTAGTLLSTAGSISSRLDGGQASFAATSYSNTATNAGWLRLNHYRGTVASPVVVNSGDQLGRIDFGGARATGDSTTYVAGSVRGVADGTPAANVIPGRVEVWVSTTASIQRAWYVDSAGKMWALGAADVAGAANFQSTLGVTGLLTATAGGTTPANWTTTGTGAIVSATTVRVGGASGPVWRSGTGDPNGAVTGSVGDMFSRTDGGAGTTLYVKESGTATDTGWVGK